jgi:hypothetical protein
MGMWSVPREAARVETPQRQAHFAARADRVKAKSLPLRRRALRLLRIDA